MPHPHTLARLQCKTPSFPFGLASPMSSPLHHRRRQSSIPRPVAYCRTQPLASLGAVLSPLPIPHQNGLPKSQTASALNRSANITPHRQLMQPLGPPIPRSQTLGSLSCFTGGVIEQSPSPLKSSASSAETVKNAKKPSSGPPGEGDRKAVQQPRSFRGKPGWFVATDVTKHNWMDRRLLEERSRDKSRRITTDVVSHLTVDTKLANSEGSLDTSGLTPDSGLSFGSSAANAWERDVKQVFPPNSANGTRRNDAFFRWPFLEAHRIGLAASQRFLTG